MKKENVMLKTVNDMVKRNQARMKALVQKLLEARESYARASQYIRLAKKIRVSKEIKLGEPVK